MPELKCTSEFPQVGIRLKNCLYSIKLPHIVLTKPDMKGRCHMAVSGKYGDVDIPSIRADEPVFILRGQDILAETAIVMYQALAESHGAAVAKDLGKEIEHFRKWEGKKRLPD